MSEWGQKRRFDQGPGATELHPTPDISLQRPNGREGPIVLQKSKVTGLKIFRENSTERATADSYDLNRVTEVACEFRVRPGSPSHLVRESRVHGPQNFGHRRKTTFTTISARS